MMPNMGAAAVVLLFKGTMHVSNFHVTGQRRDMPVLSIGARVAIMGGIEPAGGAIEPVVESFDWMLGVAASV